MPFYYWTIIFVIVSPMNDPFKSPYAIPIQKLKLNVSAQNDGIVHS